MRMTQLGTLGRLEFKSQGTEASAFLCECIHTHRHMCTHVAHVHTHPHARTLTHPCAHIHMHIHLHIHTAHMNSHAHTSRAHTPHTHTSHTRTARGRAWGRGHLAPTPSFPRLAASTPMIIRCGLGRERALGVGGSRAAHGGRPGRPQALGSSLCGQTGHSQAPGACLLRGPLCFFHGPAQMREPLSARPGLPPRPGFPPGGRRRRLPMQHRGPRPAGRGVGICILTRSPGDAGSASSLRSRRLPRAEAAFHACHSQADFTERRCTSPAAGSAAPSSRVSLREQHAGPRTHTRGLPRRGAPRRPGWNRPRAGF